MKIYPVSDLHLEHHRDYREPVGKPRSVAAKREQQGWQPMGTDVVVCAGDMHVGTRGPGWLRTLYPKVEIVYVAGNHEYYGHRLDLLDNQLCKECRRHGVHFLQCDSIEIQGVVFIGCTLWADFAAFVPKVSRSKAGRLAEEAMADYGLITVPSRRAGEVRNICWVDTARLHDQHRAWLEREIVAHLGKPMVVVTHHVPALALSDPNFVGDPTTAGWCSRMSRVVEDAGRAGARYWICGHSHYVQQVKIGECLAVNNSAGYPRDLETGRSRFNKELLLEV